MTNSLAYNWESDPTTNLVFGGKRETRLHQPPAALPGPGAHCTIPVYNYKRFATPGIVEQGCTTLQGFTEASKWFSEEHCVPFGR